MKKIVILVVTLILLTGCNVEYNLTINEDNILENINLTSENDNESNIISNYLKPIEAFTNSPTYSESNEKIPGVMYYNTSKVINNGWYNLNINYDFDFEEFRDSNIINNSVSVLKIEEENGIYHFNTGATLKIFDLYNSINNLTIKITLDDIFILDNTNADSINENTYIWNVNRSNYNKKPITLSFKKIEDNNTNNNGNNNINNNSNNSSKEEITTSDIIIIISILLVFVIIISLVIKFSKKIKK